jgi:hypothetical protein
MTVPAWMLPGAEPRSSRMWLVALQTDTFRLNVHQNSTESNHKLRIARRRIYLCHCCLRCSRYLVLCYWHIEFECRPRPCVFPFHMFHYTKTHFLVFTALAGSRQSRLEGIPSSRQRELKSETNASRTACRGGGGGGGPLSSL